MTEVNFIKNPKEKRNATALVLQNVWEKGMCTCTKQLQIT